MTTPSQTLRLATHSGKFHCDEVFAYATLRLALGLSKEGEDHLLVRTRKPEAIAAADIVWDVGFVFDAEANRFDHHQRGAPLRDDGTPFSSAGLIWRVYGERAVTALLPAAAVDAGFAPAIAAELDDTVVRLIDELDNGVSAEGPIRRDTLSLGTLVGDCNPTWDAPTGSGPAAGDSQFQHATALVLSMLARRVDGLRARLAAEAIVLEAHAASSDPRILVLDRGMPWKNVVFSHNLPVLFTVSPASNGNWMVDTVPPEPGSFAQKLPLPQAWAGLQEEALAELTGTPDAVFVHLRRFVGAARTREGALDLAHKALAIGGQAAVTADEVSAAPG